MLRSLLLLALLSPANAAPQRPLCQPKDFDPARAKLFRVTREHAWPKEVYRLEGAAEDLVINVDGWEQEGAQRVALPPPYSLTFYLFGCKGGSDYVLDIKKGVARHALVSKVTRFQVVQGKQPRLYLERRDGKSFLDIASGRETRLPRAECASGPGALTGDRLLTYSDKNIHGEMDLDYRTRICVWDDRGKPLARWTEDLHWARSDGWVLADPIGLLPEDTDVFYAYVADPKTETCALRLQHITDSSRSNRIELTASKPEEVPPVGMLCPQLELDLKGVGLASERVRLREPGGAWRFSR